MADTPSTLLTIPPGQITTQNGFDINGFYSTVSGYSGVLKNNLFLTTFRIPTGTLSAAIPTDPNNVKLLSYYIQATELPGVAMASADAVRRYGYGPTEKYAFLPVFNDITLNFIVDGSGYNKRFFDSWLNLVVNFDSSRGFNNKAENGASVYEIEYKDNYITELDIFVYNELNQTILVYTLLDAFPIATAGTPVNWGSQNELMSLGVTFTYRDWFVNETKMDRDAALYQANKSLNEQLNKQISQINNFNPIAQLSTPPTTEQIKSLLNNNFSSPPSGGQFNLLNSQTFDGIVSLPELPFTT